MDEVLFVAGSLISMYVLGFVFGFASLTFKKFMENI